MIYFRVIAITIDTPSDADQRIDKFIRKHLPNAPLGALFKWIRTGKIKVNGKKVSQTYRINQGDRIDYYLSEDEFEGFQQPKKTNESPSKNAPNLSVLYEDDILLVVNKPPGINVHPSDHKSSEVSLIELVQDLLGEKYNTLTFRPSLVHRIDRDTSGCILIAKEKKALEALLESLQNGQMQKVYHTVVVSEPKKDSETIDLKLLRILDAKNEAKVRIDASGQKAITHYQVLKKGIHGKYSLLECRIETGRTHQIRVHLAHLGHPILGDKAYGDKKENSFAKREYHIDRQLLHAVSLAFPHPVTRKIIEVRAPYMDDMNVLLR